MTALLEKEHESVDDLAVEVLDLLMDIKWSRAPWIAIQRHTAPHFTAWGPYATRGEAERDLGRRIVGVNASEVAYFVRVWNKDVTDGPDPEVWDHGTA